MGQGGCFQNEQARAGPKGKVRSEQSSRGERQVARQPGRSSVQTEETTEAKVPQWEQPGTWRKSKGAEME